VGLLFVSGCLAEVAFALSMDSLCKDRPVFLIGAWLREASAGR
jgi:hypothetical protein